MENMVFWKSKKRENRVLFLFDWKLFSETKQNYNILIIMSTSYFNNNQESDCTKSKPHKMTIIREAITRYFKN